MKRSTCFALSLLVLAPVIFVRCGGSAPPPPPIAVAVASVPATVQVGGTASVTATVSNDVSNKGVSWTLTQGGAPCSPGCGTIAPTATPSTTPTTYTAPAAVPTNPTVTITATSMADLTKSGSATVTITPLPASASVSVSPSLSALIPINITQQFIATVQNDPTNSGVTWTLNQGGTVCSTGCGTLSAPSSLSGMPITYTAPAKVPADPIVSIIATPVANTAAAIGTSITITVGTVKLVPSRLAFGNVLIGDTTPPQTTTLTNVGNITLSVTSITIPAGPHRGDWSQTNTCGPNIAAGQSCTISVIFKPTATGFKNTTVGIIDNSADSPQQVTLSGKGRNRTAAALRSALGTYQTVTAPSPSGPNPVGTRVMDLVDSSRDDPFLAVGTKRELLVRFWYPASLSQACQPAQYTSPRIWSYFSQLAEMRLPEVRTNSCWDAPITDGAHPVIVFTPGYTATFTDYTFLFEDLASRGYVVASVDHTYEATAVEFPDGRFIKSVFGSHLADTLRGDEQALSFAVSVRLEDLKFIVTALKGLNAQADSPLRGKLDTSRLALAGHSLGGLTAILGIEQEPSFKAAVVIDGVLPDNVAREIQTPILMLTSGNENSRKSHCRLGGHLRGPQYVVNFPGAEHVTPSDAIWMAMGAIKTGNMGPEKTIAAMRDYIAAFLDTSLQGKPVNSLLTGGSADYPDAAVATQNGLPCPEP